MNDEIVEILKRCLKNSSYKEQPVLSLKAFKWFLIRKKLNNEMKWNSKEFSDAVLCNAMFASTIL